MNIKARIRVSFAIFILVAFIAQSFVPWVSFAAPATAPPDGGTDRNYVTPAEREAAAESFAQAYASALAEGVVAAAPAMDPGGIPHYFGPYANYANSPMPKGPVAAITLESGGSGYFNPVVTITDAYYTGTGASATALSDPTTGAITGISIVSGGSGYTAPVVTITDASNPQAAGAGATATIGGALTGGIRKFVDTLPGLGAANANNLGQYIPVAVPDTTSYPGSDYYVIELGQYTEKMHSDLPPTTLRGYRQVNTNDPAVSQFHNMGPLIVATKDRPVRIKFINSLPTGAGGDLFLPVDKTTMGAGMGPLGMSANPMDYPENRATLHLHGGFIPWISDGTPHQWTTPAGENTPYPQGVSVYNVPDMDGGNEPLGTLTFYYNNEQSARLMFYHDHSWGITRLNVYAGEAAGYIVTDQVEQDMIQGTDMTGVNPDHLSVLPDLGIPLIIQDKTFVDAATIAAQDPTWDWGTTPPVPNTGDLWYPHVYMPAQNPYDPSGANAFGRWHYAPWFWPAATTLTHPPVPNPYYDPVNAPWEPPMAPDMPSPSMVGEAFLDTPVVNGAVYPYLEVQPTAYRFRILNAADDRFFNLQWYVADPTVTTADGRTNTEVRMIPSADGRAGGIPDPATAGPSFIQIGTEGGFLPAPVVVPNQPITWNLDPTTFNFGNVQDHALLLGCAERADVIVDFSQYAGKTLILYNDAPAAFPALDTRLDYYTGDPDQVGTGGAPTTQPGYGPNTRTIMQVRVAYAPPGTTPTPYDVNALNGVFAKTATKRGVFEVSQDPIIVPMADYNSAYDADLPADQYARQDDTSLTFRTLSGNLMTVPFEPKAIQDEMGEAFDLDYGRMSGLLGLELPSTQAGAQNFLLYPYVSPPVDILKDSGVAGEPLAVASDGTQIWRITHNGVDTHPVHFHLFNVQLINRIAWDGKVIPPDANELGWKETLRVNPLEHMVVAMRPVVPKNQPFEVPNSVRLIDPSMPEGAELRGPLGGFKDPQGNPVTVFNHYVNYGWEYVYHCHILAHEEMDMMHSMLFAVAPKAPTDLVAAPSGTGMALAWTDNSVTETGFTIQRADDPGFLSGLATFKVGPDVTSYTDMTINPGQVYYYRVQANNLVGDTAAYAAPAVGFPQTSADSAFTGTVMYPVAAPNAAYFSDTIPATMVEGTAYDVSVTYTNTGNTAWTNANGVDLVMWGQLYAFTLSNDATYNGAPAFTIPAGVSVSPGQSYTWNFRLTPMWSGNYGLGFQVVQTSTNSWLGSATNKAMTVDPAGPNAAFAGTTIPDANVEGNTYDVSVTYTNTGNTAWTNANGVQLVMWGQTWAYTIGNDATYNGAPSFTIPAGVTVAPGQSYTWNFKLTPIWSGNYALGHQVVQTSTNAWMGSATNTGSIVYPAAPNALYAGNTIPPTMKLGTPVPVTITFTNTGNSTWTSGKGDMLVMWGQTWAFNLNNDATYNGAPAFSIPAGVTVMPGQSYAWDLYMTPLWAGSYGIGFQVVQSSTGSWLGSPGAQGIAVN